MFTSLRRRLGARLSPRAFDTLFIAAWFVATRALIFVVGHLAHHWRGPDPRWASSDLLAGKLPPGFLAPFVKWDALFYVSLAREGYPPQQDGPVFHAAFFPLYPLVVRALDRVVDNTFISAVLISNVASLVALLVFASVVASARGRRAARAMAVLALLSPGSHFLSFGYTEGLFCLVIALGLWALQRGWLVTAGVIGAVATATRSTGLALTAAIGIAALTASGRDRVRGLLASLLSVAGLVAFAIFNSVQYGDPLYFSKVQAEWGRSPGLLAPLWALLRFDRDPDYYLVTLASIALVVYAARRVPRDWTVTSAVLLAVPLWTGTLRSMVRYAGTNLPLFGLAAAALPPRVFRVVVPISGLLMVYEVARFCAGFANN